MKIIEEFKKLQLASKIKLKYKKYLIDLFCGSTSLDFGIEISFLEGKEINKQYEKFSLLTVKRKAELFVVIHSKVNNYAELEVFASLIEYVLFELSKKEIASPLDIKKYIDDWLYFSNGKSLELSMEKQIGLIGELYILKKLIKEFPKSNQLNNWQGPEGSKIDFIFSDKFGVEVKSRMQPFKDWISISSVEQLDNSLKNQHMVVCDFLPSDTGLTIRKIMDEIIIMLNDRDLANILIEKTNKVKYDYFKNYSNLIKVNLLGINVFDTKSNNFPYLKKGEDLRVDKIKYDINIRNEQKIEFTDTTSNVRRQLE